MLRSGLLPVTYAEVEKLLATVLGKKKNQDYRYKPLPNKG